MGKATALELAKMGMKRLILACKNVHAGESAAVDIREKAGGLAPDVVAVRQLDLASVESIRKFANEVIHTEPELHVLINNAAYYGNHPRRKTRDGIECHFAINYLGHYLLTLLLMNLLKRSSPSRIINLTTGSWWLRMAKKVGFRKNNDANFDKDPASYTPTQAYALSKLAMVMFTRSLHTYFHPPVKDDGTQDEVDENMNKMLPSTLAVDISRFLACKSPRLGLRNNWSSPVLSPMGHYKELLAEDHMRGRRKSSVVASTMGRKMSKPRISVMSNQIFEQTLLNTDEEVSHSASEIRKMSMRDRPIISVFAVSPGSFLSTELYRNQSRVKQRLMIPFKKNPEIGAIMVVYCASANGIENLSGQYFS